MEGMQAFAAPALRRAADRERTHVVCLDTVGSPELIARSRARACSSCATTPTPSRTSSTACARGGGVQLRRGLRFSQRDRRADRAEGRLPDARCSGSVNRYKAPGQLPLADRHGRQRATTTRVAGAVTLCDASSRRRAAAPAGAARAPARSPRSRVVTSPAYCASSSSASSSPELRARARSRARAPARRRARAARAGRRRASAAPRRASRAPARGARRSPRPPCARASRGGRRPTAA